MTRILVTGGTGMIGRALTAALTAKGYAVTILTRDPGKKFSATGNNINYAAWDPAKQTISIDAIAKADHIIHLAGAGVADKRWTAKRKKEIVDSRVDGAKLIIDSLKNIPNKVRTLITASAIGWYGPGPEVNHGPEKFIETDPPAKDFLGATCRQWEAAVEPARQLGKRVVKLRTGIVLSRDGGALKAFQKPLRFGMATIMGSGKQRISWIHIDDLVRMYIAAIENESMNGAYNAVSTEVVSNRVFMLTLARATKRFFIPIQIPSFVLKTVLGEMSVEILKSTSVSADKIQETGFVFRYPLLKDALWSSSGP